MTQRDSEFIDLLLQRRLIVSPCLELGVGYEGETNRGRVERAGIAYFGTDMQAGPQVDFVVDFESPLDTLHALVGAVAPFGSILVLNVLEHTFDPIRVLNNAIALLRPEGTCVIITPTVWPLHGHPRDYWRINPDFYVEYCRRHALILREETFLYLGRHAVAENGRQPGHYELPAPSPSHGWNVYSRLIHKMFNTSGRGMLFPSHVATGVVIQKP
ncbi:MAG: hypothetical protein HOP18_26965 [Deltaproteobacteria bacterium]|nr:hypothetical protein [Deltaproteobacteria bacterium]